MKRFQCKINYEKIARNGARVKVTELYLVDDALNYTEAEARIIEEMKPYISGDFEVADIKRANYYDIFYSNDIYADKYWEFKVEFVTLDAKSGAAKYSDVRILVFSGSLQDAINTLNAWMKKTIVESHRVKSVKETAITGIFPISERG
jgi:hypothetical protein